MGTTDRKKLAAWFMLLFTCFAWGGSYVSIQICLSAMGPSYLPFFRYLFAAFFLFLALKCQKKSLKVAKEDYMKLFLTAIFSITVYFYCENNGIMRIGANEAAILVAMMPIIALVANRLFLKQRILPRNMVSAVISLCGIYLVVGGVEFSNNKVGYLYMLSASASWVLYMILTKPLSDKYDGMVITFYQCIIGTAGFLPTLGMDYFYLSKITPEILAHFIFLALCCSALCTWFYTLSIERLGVGISAMMLNFIPVATFLFSFVLLGEVLAPMKLAGAVIAILGLLMIKEDEALAPERTE